MNAMKRTVMAVVVAGVFGSAWANPTAPTVVSGAALISNPSASVMQVVNTPGTIINWQGFSIANGETTRFVQLNAASAVLNRVTGGNPSAILGRLESNGRVFLVNPNGIVFGGGSVVDVAGLIASTRNISDANFLAGNFLFDGPGNGAITVQNGAQILTTTYGPGGQVWLFAKSVTQEAGSTITAPQGQVVLAAGSQLQVATNGLGQMSFAVTTDGTSTVDSLGTIAADRGAVGLFADFINHRGTVNAGNQGSVAMDAAKELRIQGTSQINAPDGSITLRGGSVLEVEYDSIINADGANGRISFESNNLLVSPSGNTHAVNGQVIFNQYQPSQYTPGAAQQLWVTPAGYIDRDTLVYRRNDGNNVVRFNRAGSRTALPLVEPFEVVLDSRTGAVISGPTSVAALSSAAAARNTAFNAFVAADAAFTSAVQSGTLTTTISNTLNTAQAANTAADAVYKTAYWAASPPVFNSDQFLVGNPNTGAGVLPGTAIPTSDGGSLVHNGSTPGLGLFSSAGTLVRAGPNNQSYNVPMSDGTYITRTATGLDVFALDGSALRSVIEPVALGASGSNRVLIPNQLGGLSVVRLEFASHIEWDLVKTVAAYTPTSLATGAAGNAAAFATAPGVATGTGPTPPSGGGAAPTTPTTTVVRGRAGGGSIFDGIASCDFSCGERARAGVAAVEAEIVAQAAAAVRAHAAADAVDADIDAQARRTAANAVDAEIDRQAAAAARARSSVDAQTAARNVANSSTPGGPIDQDDAAAAVRALGLFSEDEQKFLALQRAAGLPMNAVAAQQAGVYMQDNGDFRRFVAGSRLDQMTPAQRMQAVNTWLEQEARSQALGQSANPRDPNALVEADIVGSQSAPQRQAWVDDMARRQAAGQF